MSITPDQPPVRRFDTDAIPRHTTASDAEVHDRPTQSELEGTTALDLLRATVSKEVRLPFIRLKVPEREGVAIEFDPNIDEEMLTAWRKRSIREDPRDGINALKLASLVLASQATALYINGHKVTSNGHPLTFASAEVWNMVNPPAGSGPDAVIRLYGVHADVIQTGEEVMRAGHYGGLIEREETDPTVLPSRH